MKMKWYEYRVFYVANGEDPRLCTFWVDEDDEIDMNRLPEPKVIAEIFKRLLTNDIQAHFTGKAVED